MTANSYNGFTGAQRAKAGKWFREQVKAKHRLPAPAECMACGQTGGLLQWHSEDYSEPFGPHIGRFGLCYRCHMMVHCRFRAPGAWERYRRELRLGYQFGPIFSADFERFVLEHLSLWNPTGRRFRGIPPRYLLEEIERGEHAPKRQEELPL